MSPIPLIALYISLSITFKIIYYCLFTKSWLSWLLIAFYFAYNAIIVKPQNPFPADMWLALDFQSLEISLHHEKRRITGLKKEVVSVTDTLHQAKKDLDFKSSIIEVFYKEEENANNTIDDLNLKLEKVTNDHSALRHRLVKSCEFVVNSLENINLLNHSDEMKWRIEAIYCDLHELLYSKNYENRENANIFDLLERSIDVLVNTIQHCQKRARESERDSLECEYLRTNLRKIQNNQQVLKETIDLKNQELTEYRHVWDTLQNIVSRHETDCEESVHLSENRRPSRIFSEDGTQTKSVISLKLGQCGKPGTQDLEDALDRLSL